MTHITLVQTATILDSVVRKGAELAFRRLTVTMLDAGGHLLAFKHLDGATKLRPQIASGKAGGALVLGMSSRKLSDLAVTQLSPNGLIPTVGGVIIVEGEGTGMGAVGITGDTSNNNENCALAGIAAAGPNAKA